MSRNIDPGGGSYLTAPNVGMAFGGEMTVSVWTRPDAGVGYLFTRANDSPQRYSFGMWVGATYGAFVGDTGFNATHVSGTAALRLGRWDHVVFRVTGGTGMSLYVNGKLDGVATSAYFLTNTVDVITFGGWANHAAGQAFDGLLGEIAAWNYALSYEQITSLYRGTPPDQLLQGKLRGWWTMRDGGALELDRSAFQSHATPTASQFNGGIGVIPPITVDPAFELPQLQVMAGQFMLNVGAP